MSLFIDSLDSLMSSKVGFVMLSSNICMEQQQHHKHRSTTADLHALTKSM